MIASTAYLLNKGGKKFLYPILAMLLLPILISTSSLTVATVPAADTEKIELYKSVATGASKPNASIDWKALMAIDAVRYKQDFSKASKSNITKLAKSFLIHESGRTENSKGTYRLKSLDTVLDELHFSKQEKEQVKKYMESLSMIYGGSMEGGIGGDLIPLFYQWDSRWGSYPYSSGGLAATGCGPTCLAMVATGLGGNFGTWDKNGDNILTPDEAANFSKSHGGVVVGSGTVADVLFPKAASSFGLSSKHYTKSQYSQVFNELKNGYPVIANVHGSESIPYGQPGSTFTQHGHFIVLTGVDENGMVKVNDPNSRLQQSEKTWDWLSIIVAESSDFYVFSNPNIKTDSYYLTYYTNGGGINGGTGTALLGAGSLSGKDIRARYIAVDTSQIPLGSLVFIKFPDNNRFVTLPDGSKFDKNGNYTAVDTGGAINGKRIDLFVGSDSFWNIIQHQCNNANVSVQIRRK